MIARAEGIAYLIITFFFLHLNQVSSGDQRKCTPKYINISPKMCHFGQIIDFIAKFCQTKKKKRGWAKTSAIAPHPLI